MSYDELFSQDFDVGERNPFELEGFKYGAYDKAVKDIAGIEVDVIDEILADF